MDATAFQEVWSTLVCFTTVLLASELTLCLPTLPRRPRFWLRVAVAIPAYVALFNSHLLVVPVGGTWLVSMRATLILPPPSP